MLDCFRRPFKSKPIAAPLLESVPTKQSPLTVDRRTAINQALNRALIQECSQIVLGYSETVDYTWSTTPYFPAVAIVGNTVESRSVVIPSNSWTRIQAAQTIGEGATSWRIQSEFGAADDARIAVGVSRSAAINRQDASTIWLAAATTDDFLISTTYTGTIGIDSNRDAMIFLGGVVARSGVNRPNDRQSVTDIRVDSDRRTMTASFRDAYSTVRKVTISLPPKDGQDWRPSIVLFGDVTATILPSDDCFWIEN